MLFRLGPDTLVRLPRRALGAEFIVHEQRFLPRLAPQLPCAVPAALRVGRAGCGYPWPWSIVPFLKGERVGSTALPPGQAQALADFLLALHVLAPPDAPSNMHRGVPLRHRAVDIGRRIGALQTAGLLPQPALQAWQAGLSAPEAHPRTWIHGDLHGGNVLVSSGRISAVIDWGDIAAGDAATDLAAFWLLIDDDEDRQAGLSCYFAQRPSPGLCARACAWAVLFGTVLLHSGLNASPEQAAMGRAILNRVARSAT